MNYFSIDRYITTQLDPVNIFCMLDKTLGMICFFSYWAYCSRALVLGNV